MEPFLLWLVSDPWSLSSTLLKAAGHSEALFEGVVSIPFCCTQEEAAEQLHAVHLWFLPS